MHARLEPQRPRGICVSHLTKTFRRANGQIVTPVADVCLQVAAGEIIVLLGPSGCGKTTLLRCVAGLDTPDAGTISIRDDVVFSQDNAINVAPENRRLGMVFQSYALWPHMTVFDNVAYPLRARKCHGKELEARVDKVLRLVDIAALRSLRPGRLSGGQQQRVALARALSAGESLILFDEPLSNVDAKVRETVRADILTMQRSVGFAAMYVTHDQTEAMELADRIVVLRAGKIVQVGVPQDIYLRPGSHYVATFIGTANELRGEIGQITGSEVVLRSPIGSIVGQTTPTTPARGEAVAIIRPEFLAVSAARPDGPNVWEGQVTARLFSGANCNYLVKVGDVQLRVQSSDPELAKPDQRVYVKARADQTLVFSVDDDEI